MTLEDLTDKQIQVLDEIQEVMKRHNIVVIQSIAVTAENQGQRFRIDFNNDNTMEVSAILQDAVYFDPQEWGIKV